MADLILTNEQILAISDIDLSYRELMANQTLPSWVDTFFWHNANSTLPVEPYPIIEGGGGFQETPEGTDYKQQGVETKSVLLANKRFIQSLVVQYGYIKYDRYGAIMQLLESMASDYRTFWMGLVMNILNGGETTDSYDGTTFFATDHVLAKQTGQANYFEIDISNLPTPEHGTGPSTPTPSELYYSVLDVIKGMRQIKSADNKYVNEYQQSYHVLLPESLSGQAQAAFLQENIAATSAQLMLALSKGGAAFGTNSKVNITYDCLPSLNLTDAFIVGVADTSEKPFVRQTDEIRIDALLYESDQFKKKDILEWPTKIYANAGNFHWTRAAMGRMI